MNHTSSWRKLALALGCMLAGMGAWADETAAVSVSKIKDLNIRIYGFVEADYISDDTQGFFEEQDNNLVARPGTFAGEHRQQMMSIRNSRLGFDFTLPKTDSGLQTEAVIETDFLGNQGANTTPGVIGSSQTERDFFNNPAVRIRHAYLNLTTDSGWNFKLGQTWSLLGWQPYYFPSEPPIQPAVGQLYRRFPQARAMYTANVGDLKIETALDAAKPDELRTALPEGHAGVRFSTAKRKGAAIGGAGSSMQDLSLGVSGAWIPVRSDFGNQDGWAGALDLFVPILPSSDGKDRANNLSFTAEGSVGRGMGGLELAGLTFGVPTTTYGAGNIDSGIAGVNSSGNLELIQVRTERVDLTYTLPNPKWTADAGAAQVEGLNIDDYTLTASKAADNEKYVYASVSYDPVNYLRFTGLWSNTTDKYLDGIHATNNRIWFASFFVF